MAIFHCSLKAVNRAGGKSAPAAAAYRAAERFVNDRTGRVHDYRRKGGVMHKEIILPEGVPPMGRAALWNLAESAEKRKDAKVAREYEIALPHELPPAARVEVARQFAQEVVSRYGVAADVCIHEPNRKGNQKNYHAHILTTTRIVTAKGFGAKTRILDCTQTSRNEVNAIREIWERLCNAALERVGSIERIDRRTLQDQGVSREPTKHLGVTATEMERRGQKTERGEINRRVMAAADRELAQAKHSLETAKGKLADARKKYAARKAARQEQAEREERARELAEYRREWEAEKAKQQHKEEEEQRRKAEQENRNRRGMSR